MPRSKSGNKREPMSSEAVMNAAADVKSGISIRSAAKKHSVSKSVVSRYLLKTKDNPAIVYSTNFATKLVFNAEEEKALVDYLKTATKMHYGLTTQDVRKLAYEFAIANKKNVPLWEENKIAGENWLRHFMKRHCDLSLRKPEAVSLARSTAFNKVTIGEFFNNLQVCLEKYGFSAAQIWNLDETGCTTVHVPPKVISIKGMKQVGSMTSGERGVNVTMIAAVSASGNSVPPMFIFPRVHFKDHMIKGAPPGSIGGANLSGWSTAQLFLNYLDHFISHVKPSRETPQLLIMDNHESHVNIEAIDKAKSNNIVLLTLPPHTSHKTQPLDRTVFGPFKGFYSKFLSEWMATPGNAGKPATIYDVAEIAGKAYQDAFTLRNIVSGFRCTGIVPFNSGIFNEDEFLSSNVTDRPCPHNSSLEPGQQLIEATPTVPHLSSATPMRSQPSTSGDYKSPEDVRPFPKAGERKVSNRGRRKGKSAILTSTPVKEEIIAQKLKKMPVKRKIIVSSSSEEDEEIIQELIDDDDVSDWVGLSDSEDDVENLTITAGNFILTKCKGAKSEETFVAKVIEKKDDDLTIIYLKQMQKTDGFIFDEDSETFSCSITDIIKKLPNPTRMGGTKRARNMFKFPSLV